MTNLQSDVSRSYNTFSGSDIRAQIGPYQFAEIQAISYSITREKAPIYTMGSPDPRSFSRNKRGIAGSLVWVNFDRHALINIVQKAGGTFVSNLDDIKPNFMTQADQYAMDTQVFNSTLVRPVGPPVSGTINLQDQSINNLAATSFKGLATPWMSDQILPFDVTLSAASEYGAAAGSKIYGCEILNEGHGVSVDDSVLETQCTWVARSIEPWQAVATPLNPAPIAGAIR